MATLPSHSSAQPRRSNRALYYRYGNDVVAATVTTGQTFSVGERKVATSGDYLDDDVHTSFDIAPDGSQLLMIRHAGEKARTIVVHNWGRELDARRAAQAQP